MRHRKQICTFTTKHTNNYHICYIFPMVVEHNALGISKIVHRDPYHFCNTALQKALILGPLIPLIHTKRGFEYSSLV